jgi:Na+/H+ antiporter NhaC
MVFLITGLDFDFGLMKVHEDNAAKGDLLTSGSSSTAEASEFPESPRGTVMDLLIPVLVLIAGVVGAMIYTGFQSGASNLVEAFANCNAEIALIFGTGMTIVLMAVMYLPRGLMSFRTFMDSFLEGAKLMLPAMLILTLAWTLKGMGDHLGLAEYVSATIGSTASGSILTPAIMFAVAAVLAFATGTSYGTFAILLPIAIPMFAADEKMMIICVASILSGGVCGDHLSPISDTTIMSSAGAQSDHMNHVRTQIQYAIVVCIASVVGYLLAALTRTWIVPLAAGAVMIVLILMALKRRTQTVPVGRV